MWWYRGQRKVTVFCPLFLLYSLPSFSCCLLQASFVIENGSLALLGSGTYNGEVKRKRGSEREAEGERTRDNIFTSSFVTQTNFFILLIDNVFFTRIFQFQFAYSTTAGWGVPNSYKGSRWCLLSPSLSNFAVFFWLVRIVTSCDLQQRFFVTYRPTQYSSQYDNSKVQRELGVHLIPVDQAIVDMAKALIDAGIVAKK